MDTQQIGGYNNNTLVSLTLDITHAAGSYQSFPELFNVKLLPYKLW